MKITTWVVRKWNWTMYKVARQSLRLTSKYDVILMPKNLTAENGEKFISTGGFEEVVEIRCSECNGTGFLDDEHIDGCYECKISGYQDLHVKVSWDTIKEIYKKAAGDLSEN